VTGARDSTPHSIGNLPAPQIVPTRGYSPGVWVRRLLSRFATAGAWTFAVIGIVVLGLTALFVLGWASFAGAP